MRGPALRAGLRYGLEAFALGFVLGVIRTLIVAPALGTSIAVLIELPLLLLAMAWRAHAIVQRSSALAGNGDLVVMGITGSLVLMLAELLLGLALGISAEQWYDDLFHMPGVAGLAGQGPLALFPLLVGRAKRVRAE
ncbi:hypothetical protein C7451_11125 [Blastomonas natatoria]|uniref:Uncharacterized protein n=1 Tax=Blastomonas natatoria TaxID=34015 RepID=A0A2V3UVL6_9SPHN|nr:hypothetical protein [Blastomonas natatoria]PXW72904.1 hypothetical protein C7451_11125 [Blastomonas natatoria]